MNSLRFLASALLASSALSLGKISSPVIDTSSGPVQGEILETVWKSLSYSSFKGIPYAQPPLGQLRFKPPIPPKPWTNVLDVTKESNACPQVAEDYSYFGDEDCLHLNVFTPETNFKRDMKLRPVFVWLYGGSFAIGSCDTSTYGPDFLMEQNVVVVCMNYRLGPLGFLYLNHSEALGNAGLKDQLLALKWVHKNIAAFGGDPKQVTLGGQSAGSSSVLLHAISLHSRAYYNRSIAESGTPLAWLYQSPREALLSAQSLATYLGVYTTDTEELLKFFHESSAKTLVIATNLMSVVPANVALRFKPTKENAELAELQDLFLTECPINLYATGNFKKHDMILGYTNNEFLGFLQPVYRLLNGTSLIWDLINPILPFNYRGASVAIKGIAMALSDLSFRGPIDFHQRLLTLYNDHPVYYYMLSYNSRYLSHVIEGVPSSSGTGHTDDMAILFNKKSPTFPTNPEDPFNQFRRKFVTLWANFIKYGNPTPKSANPLNNVTWKPSGKEGHLLNISETCAMIPRNEAITDTILSAEYFMYETLPLISGCNKVIYPVSTDVLLSSNARN